VPFEQAACRTDGCLRTVISLNSYAGDSELGSRALSDLGLPPFDVFTARSGEQEIGYLPYGDARAVLGSLAEIAANPVTP